MLQSPDEALVFLIRHPALLSGHLLRDLAALGGRSTVVSLKGVAAGEKVPTAITEKDLQWVRLCGPTVPHKFIKGFDVRARTEAAFDFLDRATREVDLRSLEEHLIPRLEYTRYLEKFCRFLLLLLHHAVAMVSRFLINTPLNRYWLLMRRLHHPTLLETRSRQGLGMNSVRISGREPLHSAPCLRCMYCIFIPRDWGPGHTVVAGPGRGPF